jgi:hypothetical protein
MLATWLAIHSENVFLSGMSCSAEGHKSRPVKTTNDDLLLSPVIEGLTSVRISKAEIA